MRFQYSEIGMDLCSGFRVGKKIAVGLVGGMNFRNCYIKSSFIYNDGTESFTNEKQLNGIYHSLKVMTYLGTSIDVQVYKKLCLNFKLDYMMGTMANSSEYFDGDLTKSSGKTSIPQDIKDINTIGYKGLSDDSKGIRCALTVKFLLTDTSY